MRVLYKPGGIKITEKEQWKAHSEALSLEEYTRRTLMGQRRLERPRPVWLPKKKIWTVGAPVNPLEWQILIQSNSTRDRHTPITNNVWRSIMPTCGHSWISTNTFYECLERLYNKHLLKANGESSPIVDKWLHPDLTGPRAGGEWHRTAIHNFVDLVNRVYGCYTYVDRGHSPGVSIPDVIMIRPKLVEHTRYSEPRVEPLEWDLWNPIYAEFKSARDLSEHPGRFEEQLEQYDKIPLYLEVEAKIGKVKKMLEEHGRRKASFLEFLQEPESDMVYLIGSERPRAEWFFDPVLKRVKQAFLETYDRKARLKKTGTDPQGRECHDLILYDALGTPKNIGQVIPNYAEDVEDFVDLYFEEWEYLDRITTRDYVYEPSRKPTRENKTWKWNRKKTTGSKYRSFSA